MLPEGSQSVGMSYRSFATIMVILVEIIANSLLTNATSTASPIHADSMGGGGVDVSKADAQLIAQDLIDALDLSHLLHSSNKVRHNHPYSHDRSRVDRSSVPTFMRDVYNELEAEENDDATADDSSTPTHPFGWRPRHLSFLQRRYNVSTWIENSLHFADMIVSVAPDDSPKAKFFIDYQQRLVFRFDHLQSHHKLMVLSSELRIFRHEYAYHGEQMRLLLHRLRVTGRTLVPVEMSVTELRPEQTGWVEANITSFTKEWIQNPTENGGIYVRLLNAKGLDVAPDLLGFEMRSGQALSPFVVASFRQGQEIPEKRRRVRRNAPGYRNNYRQNSRHRYSDRERHRRPPKRYRYRRSCRRLKLQIDFQELNWDSWVIAPKVYNAYYCSGACSFPIGSVMNTTNHAVVQSLMSLHWRRSRIPMPCCVPTKLRPIKVLYFDQANRVLIRLYRNMTVVACGCH